MPRTVAGRPPTSRPATSGPPAPRAPRAPRRPGGRALVALGLSAFVVGTAEFVVVGVLDRIAAGLHITVGTAGLLVTAYALGVCVGGPVLTALTIRLPRRLLICATLALYALANGVAAIAGDFLVLVAVRAVTGSVHGLFVGVASATAGTLAGPERKGRAVAVVFGGIAAANLLGVPLATYVGHVLPWQSVFAGIAVLSCAALALAFALVPRVPDDGRVALRAQTRYVLRRPVLIALGTAVVLFCGQFALFTLLGPYLREVTGVSGGAVGGYLLVFGAAGTVGTLVGGRCADRNTGATLLTAGTVLTLALTALHPVGAHPVAAALALAAFGLFGFALAPALQVRTLELAGPGADLASTLGASAGNAGIAAGSAVAGWVGTGHGVAALPLTGAVICAAALPLVWVLSRTRAPAPGGARR
ncbi:MFS transporter [Streptomyces tendae]|uniref:MFS transporter n=1 Tax=Streptomyces tendae TaxID=1932 RepID=UPI00371F8899